MDTNQFRKIMITITVLGLLVLSFLLLKPILMSIIFGLVLTFILTPVYKFFFRITKKPNLSSSIVCTLLVLIIILPLWFLTPLAITQAFKIYFKAQQIDFVALLEGAFPSFFTSGQFSGQFGGVLQSFVIKGGNYILEGFSQLLLNFPIILLQVVVVLFTLYFALRDREELLGYIKSLSPFSKDIEERLFKSSRDITASILYGQLVIGILQGIILTLAYFIFGVPNALILGVASVIFGILPIVGPMFVWVPVVVFLLISGNTLAVIGVVIFGLIGSNIDNLLRPMLVSRMAKLPSAIALFGMIGGLFVFGVMGIILGPLILAYLLIVLEVFRHGKNSNLTLIRLD